MELVFTMVRPKGMSAAIENRVMLAIDRMIEGGEGIYSAARSSGTTRASIFKWLTANNIKTRIGFGGKIIVEPPMEARVNSFLSSMAQGKSATVAAKESGTTLRTMKFIRRLDSSGVPIKIISKVGSKWESNFVPIYDHNLVVYGKLIGFGGNLQGKPGVTAGPLKRGALNRADPNYADIWWQYDLEGLKTTMSAAEAVQFWKPFLVSALEGHLEPYRIKNLALGQKFMGNSKVAADAVANNRLTAGGDLENVNELENLLARYKIRFAKKINVGIDSNRFNPASATPEFLSKTDPLLSNIQTVDGVFQSFFLTQGNLEIYPPNGLILPFQYMVA